MSLCALHVFVFLGTMFLMEDEIRNRALKKNSEETESEKPAKTQHVLLQSTQPNGDVAAADDGDEATIPPDNEGDTQTKIGSSNVQESAAQAAGAVLGKVLEQGLAGLQNSKDLAALAAANAVRQ